MSTIAKVSSIKELEEIKRNKFCKKRFLYPILFQEDFYGIAYNRFLNGVKYRKNQIYTFGNEYNFLTLKRLIGKSRQLNYSWIIYNQSLNKFRIIQEILIMIFNFIFAKESIIKENEWNSNQSIHALFPFLESKIQNSTVCLDINIPYSIHPEILIRIVRQNIPDTSLLHFFRLLLYQNEHIDVSNPQFSLRKNQFYNLLWNFQIHKFEYSLIHICKQIYNFQSVLDWFFVDQTNFVQKIGYISEYSEFTPIKAFIRKNCLIQYGRYRNNLIISTNVNMNFSFKNWNLFFLIFWEKYFQVWIEIYRMNIKDLSKTPFCFLGYLFRIKNKYTLIQIQLMENSIYTNLIIKEFYNIIPIVPLIRLLAKEKFCDTSGRPICKVSWTTLTDHEIFRRFDQLIKNFFCYYSGCVKKKGLYQLQYILRFSCAKTLACKHKSTIRTVWKKYGSNFVANSVHLKKSRLNSWHTYEKKFWFLNIIKINHLAQLRDKFKNVRNS